MLSEVVEVAKRLDHAAETSSKPSNTFSVSKSMKNDNFHCIDNQQHRRLVIGTEVLVYLQGSKGAAANAPITPLVFSTEVLVDLQGSAGAAANVASLRSK
jgi:hypothetical protein